jgi:hypothetical protein
MARRGAFSRSGGAQNLSLLVYQVLREQLNTDMNSIMQNYQTNMKAGRYSATYNGQNVDGQFVMDYIRNMMQGFPPGSTEYESLNSQLRDFEGQYQTDVQNLVISSMQNGTKVDFGLLGPEFSNKGISEVTLTDIRDWGSKQVAALEDEGNTTQADKLKGAIYVAGFNVEQEGKANAVTKGELSYAAYNKWLLGQMDLAVQNGLGKDSDAYLAIAKIQAQAQKDAKVDGYNKAGDAVDKSIRGILSPVDQAAEAMLTAFEKSGDPLVAGLESVRAAMGSTSGAPSYELLQKLVSDPSTKYIYDAIMKMGGPDGKFDELFAQAVSEAGGKFTDLYQNGLGGIDPANLAKYQQFILSMRGQTIDFSNKTGIEFNTSHSQNVLDVFKDDLRASGVAIDDTKPGDNAFTGGHPDAVMESLKHLGESLDKLPSGNSYQWLKELAQGKISNSLVSAEMSNWDSTKNGGNGDGFLSVDELKAGFSSGQLTSGQINDMEQKMSAIWQTMPTLGNGMSSGSLITSFLDAAWGQAAMDHGSVIVVNNSGVVHVSEWGQKDPGGNAEMLPTVITVNGKTSVAYVMPMSLTSSSGNNQENPIDPTLLGGLDAKVYRLPGNLGSTTNVGQTDAFVVLKGSANTGNGTVTSSFKLTFDQFRAVAQHFGLEFDANSFTNPSSTANPSVNLSANTSDPEVLKNAWPNLFNPNSDYYIGKLKDSNGNFIVPDATGKDFKFNGFVGDDASTNKLLNGLLSSNKDKIIAEATAYASSQGRTQLNAEDVARAALKNVPGIAENSSFATVLGLVSTSPAFLSNVSTSIQNVDTSIKTKPSVGYIPSGVPSGYVTTGSVPNLGGNGKPMSSGVSGLPVGLGGDQWHLPNLNGSSRPSGMPFTPTPGVPNLDLGNWFRNILNPKSTPAPTPSVTPTPTAGPTNATPNPSTGGVKPSSTPTVGRRGV